MILVTGATGQAGSQVVRSLLARQARVRVLVRDAERARRLFGDAVDVAEGDLAYPPSVRAALDGADVLFLSCADDPRRVEWEIDAIDAAAAAGVRRVVRLSALLAEPGSPVAFWDWHGRIDEHLRAADVPAVVLRASFFMSNLLQAADAVAHAGCLVAPAGESRIGMIDPRDVGDAAAVAILGTGHDGRTYELTGPAAVSHAQVARALGAAIGRPVEYVAAGDDEAQRAMVDAGLPPFVAEQVVRMYAVARTGGLERVTPMVPALTGRVPRDLTAFVRDHADWFAPVAQSAGR